MLHIEENELHKLMEEEYHKGIIHGVKLMKQKILFACENGTPINIGDISKKASTEGIFI